MSAYANVDGDTVIEGTLIVPNVGPWWAELVFETEPELSGAVTFNLGILALSGTVDANHNGTFGEQRRTRIVGGGGGWGTLVGPQHYHSDAGVTAREVAEDAARIAGETLGDFAPAADRIGIDYVRQSGPASRVLEDVIGGVPWHVAYDGSTVVGPREVVEAPTDAYQVLDFDPRESLITISIDDLTRVGIGSTLTEGLDAPVTVFELEVKVGVESSRTVVWGGGEASQRGRLARALQGVVRSVTRQSLLGKYRYRVVKMSANRVELQAVAQIAGLPDLIPARQKPGVSGAHAKLAGGSIVLVEFVEGDRTIPIVSAYAGKDEEGHDPDELDFSVATTLRLGSDSASEGATLGDSHKSWAEGHTHGPGSFQTVVGSGGGGGPVTGESDSPSQAVPATSAKVKVDA